MIEALIEAIAAEGGVAYLVGGSALDAIRGETPKDLDIEVHGLTIDQLTELASEFGNSDLVGKSFGVVKLRFGNTLVDLSLPRTEAKTGTKHNDFDVEFITNHNIAEAARRRDFTINAIYINLHNGEIIDPFNGVADYEAGILRVVDPKTFVEDPLRPLRAMQIAARKCHTIDNDVVVICRSMEHMMEQLPAERVFEEFQKLLLLSKKPSSGLLFLHISGWLKHGWMKYLDSLRGCLQNPKWHPEGDVWNHTLSVVDNMAAILYNTQNPLLVENKAALMWAALLHDIGKPQTWDPTTQTNNGHNEVGAEIAYGILCDLKQVQLAQQVRELVRWHMIPMQMAHNKIKKSTWVKVHAAVNLELLATLYIADHFGRGQDISEITSDIPYAHELVRIANEDLVEEKIAPIITGKYLIEKGWKPGKEIGQFINTALWFQLNWNLKKRWALYALTRTATFFGIRIVR